jgi:hypothetical protein
MFVPGFCSPESPNQPMVGVIHKSKAHAQVKNTINWFIRILAASNIKPPYQTSVRADLASNLKSNLPGKKD